jgi:HsdM N-terminal domain
MSAINARPKPKALSALERKSRAGPKKLRFAIPIAKLFNGSFKSFERKPKRAERWRMREQHVGSVVAFVSHRGFLRSVHARVRANVRRNLCAKRYRRPTAPVGRDKPCLCIVALNSAWSRAILGSNCCYDCHVLPSEYAAPVLSLLFLRYAEKRFAEAQTILASKGGRRTLGKTAFQAQGVVYLPEKARFSSLLHLPEGANLGKAINDAIARDRRRE